MKKKNAPNKAQSVRDYLSKHKNATPQKVAKALSGEGINVTANYVSK